MKSYGYPALRLPRSGVKQELLQAIRDKEIPILYEKKLQNIKENEQGVALTFADGAVVEANLVIGTDGIHSVVGQHVKASCEPYHTGMFNIYGIVKENVLNEKLNNGKRLPGTCMLFRKEGCFTILPTDFAGKDIAYFANVTLPNRSREEWQQLEGDKDELRRLLEASFCQGEWPKEVEILCRETPPEEFRTWV
jgi:2-polyprenyl-6-methoxyphenol hydroxylase-like FAD-dependent oxidoreductase